MKDSLTNELAKADEGISHAEADLSQYDDRLQAVDAEMEAAAEHCNRANHALEEGQKQKEQFEDKVRKAMAERHDLQSSQRDIKVVLDEANARLKTQQEKVEAEENRLIEVSNGGYARRQAEYEEAKNFAAAARAEYESYERGQPSLREAIKSAERKTQDAKKQLDIKIQDINQADNRLRELTRENAQARNGFPEKMPALLRAIQQERSFTTRPVGPIGHHVTLLKPKWASIIENTLGNSLSSFVVKSHGDQKILSNIMKRVGW